MGKQLTKYIDLADFCRRNPQLREKYIAEELLGGMRPARFSKLKSRKYGLRPTDEEVPAIAALLKQPKKYVIDYYSAPAAKEAA